MSFFHFFFLSGKTLGAGFLPLAFTGRTAAVSITQPEGPSLDMELLSIDQGIRHLFPGFIIYHLHGGTGDGHSLGTFLLGTS